MEYADFKAEFRGIIQKVSHHKLIELMKELRAVTHTRYGGGRPPKYELVERGFTLSEYQRFIKTVNDPTDKACFLLMGALGLRVNELCALRGRDLQGDQLSVRASKGGFGASLRLPPALISLIPCVEPEERLFPRSSKQLRDRFAIYRERAGLTDIYAHTNPCGKGMVRNPRYRISLHSLRHYAIQQFYTLCNGNLELTRKFARHRKVTTTIGYLKKIEKEDVERIIDLAIQTPNLRSIKSHLQAS